LIDITSILASQQVRSILSQRELKQLLDGCRFAGRRGAVINRLASAPASTRFIIVMVCSPFAGPLASQLCLALLRRV